MKNRLDLVNVYVYVCGTVFAWLGRLAAQHMSPGDIVKGGRRARRRAGARRHL